MGRGCAVVFEIAASLVTGVASSFSLVYQDLD
jgi:hypothetical protein